MTNNVIDTYLQIPFSVVKTIEIGLKIFCYFYIRKLQKKLAMKKLNKVWQRYSCVRSLDNRVKYHSPRHAFMESSIVRLCSTGQIW